MGREALETGKSYARKENREKSHKLKMVVEYISVLFVVCSSVICSSVVCFSLRWYITACLCADENMGMIQ